MKHNILLSTYTKKLYAQRFPYYNISEHRERDWIKKLEILFKLSESDTKYDYNTTLCILAFLTACFMENHRFDIRNNHWKFTKSPTHTLTNLAYYDEDSLIDGVNIKLQTDEINYFFSFYIHYENIWENFKYESEQEKQDVLAYRKKYIDTYNLWSMVRQADGSMNRFNSDIPSFVQALYYKDKLPDAQKYYDTGELPDNIIEQLTSFKIIDGELQ